MGVNRKTAQLRAVGRAARAVLNDASDAYRVAHAAMLLKPTPENLDAFYATRAAYGVAWATYNEGAK